MDLFRRFRSNKSLGISTVKPEWKVDKSTTIFVFKALTPEAGAMAMFQNVAVISSNFTERIQKETGCPGADVKLIEPGEWDAPEIPSLSQQDIARIYPIIVDRVCETLNRCFGIENITPSSLIAKGAGAMPHPNGHVLFLFRIPGRQAVANKQ